MSNRLARPAAVGSRRADWVAYAESLDLEIDSSMRVPQIIEACNIAESEIREEAAAEPEVFDPNDPQAYVQHAKGVTHFSAENGNEYRIDPLTGYAVERVN